MMHFTYNSQFQMIRERSTFRKTPPVTTGRKTGPSQIQSIKLSITQGGQPNKPRAVSPVISCNSSIGKINSARQPLSQTYLHTRNAPKGIERSPMRSQSKGKPLISSRSPLPQTISKTISSQVKTRTVRDVRLQNTKTSNLLSTARSRSKTPAISGSTSKSSKSKGRLRTETAPEVSLFTLNTSAISTTSRQQDNSDIESMVRYIPSLTITRRMSLSDFQILRSGEEGSYFRDVLAIHNLTRSLFTIRMIDKAKLANQHRQKQLVESIKIQGFLSSLALPHILTLYTMFSDACVVYLILQPILPNQQSNLWSEAKLNLGLDQSLVAGYTKDILETMHQLHAQSIMVRTLHLNSMQLQFGLLKLTLIDQVAEFRKRTRRDSFLGFVQEIPQQLALGQSYDASADLWQVGICLYALATGVKPFAGISACSRIKTLEFDTPISISQELGSLLHGLISQKGHRLSLDQALKHEFLHGACRSMASRELWAFWS